MLAQVKDTQYWKPDFVTIFYISSLFCYQQTILSPSILFLLHILWHAADAATYLDVN